MVPELTAFIVIQIILLLLSIVTSSENLDHRKLDKISFESSLQLVNNEIDDILQRWQVHEFPAFMKNAAMTQRSWDILKSKFHTKITDQSSSNRVFVISYLGSSVTAGHTAIDTDGLCTDAFPNVIHSRLSIIFDSLGIKLLTRNAGIGNQPCVPYDICVEALAGHDVDLVHWEHSYDCLPSDGEYKYSFEQFIRQSLALPNQPVIVFSTSKTPNWDPSSCPQGTITSPPSQPTSDDAAVFQLVNTDPKQITTVINFESGHILKEYTALHDLLTHYNNYSGIQLFRHDFNLEYMCHGPYVAEWSTGHDRHPSKLGHQLRSDHTSLHWLLILKETLTEIISTVVSSSLPGYKFEPVKVPVLFPSHFQDDVTCYSTFLPLANPDRNLLDLLIEEKGDVQARPFELILWENFTQQFMWDAAQRKKCYDMKMVLWGNSKDQRVSLRLNVRNEGYVHICTMPPSWKYFMSLDDVAVAYVTEDVDSYDSFQFDAAKAKEIPIIYTSYRNVRHSYCTKLNDKIKPGQHVLSIVPRAVDKACLAFLIIP